MKCKTKNCNREAEQRGVCTSCYAVVYRAIQAGKLTWDEAVERGLLLPPQRVRSPMHKEIAKL